MRRFLGLAFVLCAVSLSAQDLPIGREHADVEIGQVRDTKPR